MAEEARSYRARIAALIRTVADRIDDPPATEFDFDFDGGHGWIFPRPDGLSHAVVSFDEGTVLIEPWPGTLANRVGVITLRSAR